MQPKLIQWKVLRASLGVLQLEDRVAPTVDLMSIEEVREAISGKVSGITVITHGYQLFDSGGDALLPLATAIQARTDGYLLNYSVTDTESGFNPAGTNPQLNSILPNADDPAREVVLLFDWATESNEQSFGWTEAAGESLFTTLVGLGVVDLTAPVLSTPMHFIGHSFGAAVTSEAVRRLGAYSVVVDHVTYLDPHDFNQANIPLDGFQRQWELASPENYGAAVWQNVTFADVYFQTRNQSGIAGNPLVPGGRPIPGAYNHFLDDGEELPSASYWNTWSASQILSGDHSYVWNTFYLGTVLGEQPSGTLAPANPDTVNYETMGYSLARTVAAVPRPDGNFFNIVDSTPNPLERPHKYTEPTLWDLARNQPANTAVTVGFTPTELNSVRWPTNLNPLILSNSDFDAPGNAAGMLPGWSKHGGGGPGQVGIDAANYFLQLTPTESYRIRNRAVVDPAAGWLLLDVQRMTAASQDRLEVLIGTDVVGTIPLNQTDAGFRSFRLPIPFSLRGTTQTVTLRLVSTGTLSATVRVDNLRFDRGGATGDILSVDLRALAPDTNRFELIGFRSVQRDAQGQIINPVDYINVASGAAAVRGDWQLAEAGSGLNAGYVLFSDRVDSTATNPDSVLAFEQTGRLYFAPGTSVGLQNDINTSTVAIGFQGEIEILYRADGVQRSTSIHIAEGYSTVGPNQVLAGPTVLDVLRLQQRLRLLGFPDNDGELLVVDGIVGPRTRHAIGLLNAALAADDHQSHDSLSPAAARWINRPDAPRWSELPDSAHYDRSPAIANNAAYATSWLLRLLEQGSASARQAWSDAGINPLPTITIVQLSSLNGASSTAPGHQSGMRATIESLAGVDASGVGPLSAPEQRMVELLVSFYNSAPLTHWLQEIRLANRRVVQAVNLELGLAIASYDADANQLAHLKLVAEAAPVVVYRQAQIEGHVWHDFDRSGERNAFVGSSNGALEPTLSGWTIYVDANNNAQLDPQERSTVTDGAGQFAFTGLAPGLYTLRIQSDSSWQSTSPAGSHSISVVTGRETIADTHFGVWQSPPASRFADQLDRLAEWGRQIGQTGDLSQPIPGLSLLNSDIPVTMGELVNFEQILDLAIVQPITALNSDPTIHQIAAALEGQFTIDGTTVTTSLELIGGYRYGFSTDQDHTFFHVNLTGQATRATLLRLAESQEQLRLQIPDGLPLDVTVDFDLRLTLGYLANPLLTPEEAFFVQVRDWTTRIGGTVDEIDGTALYGILGLTVEAGSLELVPGTGTSGSFIQVTVNNGERFTANQSSTVLTTAVSTAGQFQMLGSLSLRASYAGQTLTGVPGQPFTASINLSGSWDQVSGLRPSASFDSATNSLLRGFTELSPAALTAGVAQFSNWLNTLGQLPQWAIDVPLSGSTLGSLFRPGDLVSELLTQPLGYAQINAVGQLATFVLSEDVSFSLTINRELNVPVILLASSTTGNGSLADLVADVQAAITAALASTSFAEMVRVKVLNQGLSLVANSPTIRVLEINGATTLGFAANQESRSPGFLTLQELAARLTDTLGQAVIPLFDAGTQELTFTVPALEQWIDQGTQPIALPVSFGPLASLNAGTEVSTRVRLATDAFTFGFRLAPLGALFELSSATTLASLNAGAGVIIETDKPFHLSIALSDGSPEFLVDLRGATTVGQVRDLIENQSRLVPGLPARVAVDILPKGLRIRDLTFSTNPSAVMRVGPAHGSRAAAGLGLLGEDLERLGQVTGAEVHGQSVADQFFVTNLQVTTAVEVTVADLVATASIGSVLVGVSGGSGSALVTSTATLRDPGTGSANDQRIFLRELIGGWENGEPTPPPLNSLVSATSVEGAFNLQMPLVLQQPIDGFTLPENAAVLVQSLNIFDPDATEVVLQNLEELQRLARVTVEDVKNAFTQLTEFLELLADDPLSALGLKIPGVFKSIAEWIDFVRDLYQRLQDADLSLSALPSLLQFPTGARFTIVADGTPTEVWLAPGEFADLGALSIAINIAIDSASNGRLAGKVGVKVDNDRLVVYSRSSTVNELSVLGGQALGFNSLQLIGRHLERAFGAPAGTIQFSYVGDALKLEIDYDRVLANVNQELNLDLEPVQWESFLSDVNGQAALTAELTSQFRLSFGFDVNTQTESVRPFLDTNRTGLNFGVRVWNENPIQFNASVGPFGVLLNDGQFRINRDGTLNQSAPATVTTTITGTNGRRYFSELSLSDFQLTSQGGVFADLPVYLPTNSTTTPDGRFTLSGPFTDPTLESTFNPSLPDLLGDLSGLVNGWNGLFALLKNAIDSRLATTNLPLIGTNLSNVSEFLERIRSTVGDLNPLSLIGPEAVADLRLTLFEKLGPGPDGLKLIRDLNNDGQITLDDVGVVASGEDVRFDLNLAGDVSLGEYDLDLGLPGW